MPEMIVIVWLKIYERLRNNVTVSGVEVMSVIDGVEYPLNFSTWYVRHVEKEKIEMLQIFASGHLNKF